MIAQRRYKKLKVIISSMSCIYLCFLPFVNLSRNAMLFLFQYDYRHHLEALRLKKKEERELKEAGNKRAKEIAEQNYRVRLYLNSV